MMRIALTFAVLMVLTTLGPGAQAQTVSELLDQGERMARAQRLPAAEGAFLAVLAREPENVLAIEALAQITAFREKWHESILFYAAYAHLHRTDELIVEDCQRQIDGHAKKIQKKGFLVVEASPADATIVVNGLPVGFGKVSLPIAPSERYSVSARRDDFTSPAPVVFTTGPSENKELIIALTKIVYTGTVQLKLFPADDVSVFVDGTQVGVSPESVQVEEGRHLLCFLKPGHDRWWRSVTIRRNEAVQLEVNLRSTGRGDEPCNFIPEDF